jgi:uncharacterized protein
MRFYANLSHYKYYNHMNKKELEYKKLITEFKVDEEHGTIEAYVSIFNNVDLGGDKILPGAFAESIAKKLPVGCWSHNWDEPIAKTLEAREDEKGLYIKAKLIKGVQRADEAYLLLKEGVITEFSIGFRIQEYSWEKEDGKEDEIRVIRKIKLYEWSPVLAGMNPDTELIGVKNEKPKENRKCKFIKHSEKCAIIYFSDGTTEEIKFTKRYLSYLSAQRKKVEPKQDNQKIIRLVAKQIDKQVEKILKITK